MISKSAVIHPNVELGEGVTIEAFCIIGLPFNGNNGEKTVIGNNSIIRAGTYIYAGNIIGKNFQTGNKVNIRELNRIGDNVSIGTLSVIEHHVEVGNGVRIHTQVFVPEFTILEEGCWLGPNVVITNAKYPCSPRAKENLRGAVLRSHAIVGANSTLLPGIEIGEHALVGAGSVVTKNIQKGAVVAGNPAHAINEISKLPYGRP